jgi:hypothetical protein
MKQDYTMHIYKADRRCKTGVRPVSRTIWTDRTEAGMQRECAELSNLYPATQGYRFDYYPSMKTVKNLMSGKDVQIDADTPWCCNPASETYWSM